MCRSGPPLEVFVVLIGTIFVYLIPSALVSTDLAVTYPLDGGYVAWIEDALGGLIGAQNMYWCVMCRAGTASLTVAGRGSTTSSRPPSTRCWPGST